ncbi:hypothetical protein BGZ93_004191 [Podila epicladia]|nr:hypothetical protein BGZ92_008644 [Podila epicladia]KAG0096644.1 hypothetical protein BGZ93_004191 [Podila epicladia]
MRATSSGPFTLGRILGTLFALATAVLVQQAIKPKRSYYWSNLRNMLRPLQFHGKHIHNNFFEGWYYKFTNNESTRTMAVIAGVYHPPDHPGHVIQQNHTHAFVMVLGLDAPLPSAYYRFPLKDFVDLGDRTPGHESAFKIRIGNSVFAHDELILDLPVSHYDRISDQELDAFYDTASQQYLQQFQNSKESQLRPLTVEYFRDLFPNGQELTHQGQEAFSINAHFQFPASTQTPLPTSLLMPSIMGATAYMPFLECIHGVASLHHPIQKGQIATFSANDNILSESFYDGGVGYLEKDWGINFPSTWIWAQANVFKTTPGSSMLFSLASIPVLGPDFSDWVKKHLPFASGWTEWPGMLLVYYHAPSKTLYNFSSYVPTAKLRSVKVSLDIDKGTQTVYFKATTRDHNWSEIALEANITRAIGGGIPLRTPSRAKRRMAIGVEEATTAHTTVKLWRLGSGEILVEDEGQGSGLEVEGNVKWLEDHVNGE